MSSPERILSWLLFAGAAYFLGIAIVHMIGVKIPFLFIYFNVPSYAYQDRIISFFAFGWSVFLYTAARKPSDQLPLLSGIITSGVVAIIALSIINSQTNFDELDPSINPWIFWLETGLLLIYLLAIIGLRNAVKSREK